ncbi:Arv1-like family-domain-containing protein [Mycena epipterygia]|nr:Arv1-like family-domain-containing protein [Mycena epipterygia]
MPICTTCTTSIPFLYTVYESSHNLRLEQCTNCYEKTNRHTFADPYVEHDSLTLLFDLILLKRGVYRHLLYNRGADPRRSVTGTTLASVTSEPEKTAKEKEKIRWLTILRFGVPLICIDAFIRWSHLNPNQPADVSPWTKETMNDLFRTFIGVFVETVAFHAGVMCACCVVLGFVDVLGPRRTVSDIRREFRFSLIPLTLFYSSLTKLFLLFLLTIWRPSLDSGSLRSSPYALQIFDDDNIDREWIVRNVLGGMSAGFGLRVVLDSHPLFTTIIIVCGWAAKTAASHVVSGWVGGDEQMGAAWLAYSIP